MFKTKLVSSQIKAFVERFSIRKRIGKKKAAANEGKEDK